MLACALRRRPCSLISNLGDGCPWVPAHSIIATPLAGQATQPREHLCGDPQSHPSHSGVGAPPTTVRSCVFLQFPIMQCMQGEQRMSLVVEAWTVRVKLMQRYFCCRSWHMCWSRQTTSPSESMFATQKPSWLRLRAAVAPPQPCPALTCCPPLQPAPAERRHSPAAALYQWATPPPGSQENWRRRPQRA